jgi:hypothetical protein
MRTPENADLRSEGATGRGHSWQIRVSPEDRHWLERYAWRVETDKRTRYVVATERLHGGPGGKKTIRLHLLILDAKPGQIVDHINGNGLDNRRKNLRLCTATENARNRQRKKSTVSRYKGVSLHSKPPEGRPWQAQICVDGAAMHLGFYAAEDEAARVYDAAAQKHFGAFARLNFKRASGQLTANRGGGRP